MFGFYQEKVSLKGLLSTRVCVCVWDDALPEYVGSRMYPRLLFFCVLQFLDSVHLVCVVAARFSLLIHPFRQSRTTNLRSALQNLRGAAAEGCSRPGFGPQNPTSAAGRRPLLSENRCETGVHTQQVWGGHLSSGLSRRRSSGLPSARPGRATHSSFLLPLSPELTG